MIDSTYTDDYLLDKKVRIYQPVEGYRASTDAVLLSAALSSEIKNCRILDVGSGTGAISLCLSHRLRDKNVEIHGLEIQSELVALSSLSAESNGFDFLHFHQADIRLKNINQEVKACSFDVVVTNPPYSEQDMPSPKKGKATAHNLNDFDLEGWINFCLKMLKPFGHIYMIHRTAFLPKICNILQKKAGDIRVIPIYSKENQSAKRIILSARKDSKAPCCIFPPFVVHDNRGNYTENAQRILRNGDFFDQI